MTTSSPKNTMGEETLALRVLDGYVALIAYNGMPVLF